MAFYTEIHSTRHYALGTRRKDNAGGEFIYLKGVASTARGSWVTFDEAHLTIRGVANAQGRVAIAKAATLANQYGWYGIYGKHPGLCLTGFADNGKVFLTATDGSVDDADVVGDAVIGAIGRSARATTGVDSGMADFELNYPCVVDTAID